MVGADPALGHARAAGAPAPGRDATRPATTPTPSSAPKGAEALEAACRAARPLLLFALDRVFSEEDTASPRGRATGSARVALMLSKVQDGDEAIELGREAARRLGVDPSDLWLQAQRLAEAVRPATPAAAAATAAAPQDVTWFERDLCQLVLQAPGRARRPRCP